MISKVGGKILSQKKYEDGNDGEFALSLLCDLDKLDETLDDLVAELCALQDVTNVEATVMKNHVFDGKFFPRALMEQDHVFSTNSSLLFQIQHSVETNEDKASLLEVGRDYGVNIGNQILQKQGSGSSSSKSEKNSSASKTQSGAKETKDSLKRNASRFLMLAGWGKFNWESDGSMERIMIQDPPSLTGGSGAGNIFLHGMVGGVLESFQGKRFKVVQEHYDEKRRLLMLGLAEYNKAIMLEKKTREDLITTEHHMSIIEEVEKIINGIEELKKETTVRAKAHLSSSNSFSRRESPNRDRRTTRENPLRETGQSRRPFNLRKRGD
jgi:hypothetical protein